jgi:predicted amidohydrolase YtcJ
LSAADLVLRGGTVFTAEPGRPWARSVAVRGEHIVAITDDDAAGWIGAETRVVDLDGGMILPGFIDTHSHYVAGPTRAAGVDLCGAHDLDTLLDILRADAATTSDDVVRGFGWRSHLFPEGPHRQLLDDIYGGRPVLLAEINGHSVWASSAALERAGIDRSTTDPKPGYAEYRRDANGELTGWVTEDASRALMDLIAPATSERAARDLRAFVPRYAAAGLTTVFDAGILGLDEKVGFELLAELDRSGELPQRIFGSHVANFNPGDPVATLGDLAAN